MHYQIPFDYTSFIKLAFELSKIKPSMLLLSADNLFKKRSMLFLGSCSQISIDQTHVNPFEQLKEKMSFSPLSKNPSWCGYFSYEMSAFSDVDKTFSVYPTPLPLAFFFKPLISLVFQNNQLSVRAKIGPTSFEPKDQKKVSPLLSKSGLLNWASSLPDLQDFQMETEDIFKSDLKEQYIKKIERAKNWIIEGDIYQVNLSRSQKVKINICGFNLFYQLAKRNRPSYAAYLNTNEGEIVSLSPERFLKKRQNLLKSQPIKGTIAKRETFKDDITAKKELLEDDKEAAELAMITDLVRNDLGKVSEVGSVKCSNFKKIIELSNVFHLEATVISQALKNHPIDIIRACFPAGSISGCPKLRAQEIILELEKRARHIYCGSIGYFLENGDFDFNVAIRTALLKEQVLEVQSGGAITFLSDPDQEYSETISKNAPFFEKRSSIQCERRIPASLTSCTETFTN